MTGTWDLDRIQLYLLCDHRKISNCSRPEVSGLYNGVNNEHLVVKIKLRFKHIKSLAQHLAYGRCSVNESYYLSYP